MAEQRKTQVGDHCRACERRITSKAWLKHYPYTDTCGPACFRYSVETENAEWHRRHPGYPRVRLGRIASRAARRRGLR